MDNNEKKLRLNKQTITNLDEKTLSNLRGGMGLNALDRSCCGGEGSCFVADEDVTYAATYTCPAPTGVA